MTSKGGTWHALNDTNAAPGTTANWLLVQNGIKSIEQTDDNLIVNLSNGDTLALNQIKGPKGDGFCFKGLYDHSQPYKKNDVVVMNGASWIATKDTNKSPPFADWSVFVKRGPKGVPGKKPTGEEIKTLVDQQLDKALVEDIEPFINKAFNQAVAGGLVWGGAFDVNKSYPQGVMVRNAKALYVSIKQTTGHAPTTSPQDWAFIISTNVAKVVKGGSGGSTPALNVTYDNSTSGLSATNVQAAIDEVSKNQFQLASLRTSVTTPQTFNDTTPVIIDIFDELTTESDFVSGDTANNQIIANVDGFFDVIVAMNVVFAGAEELQVFANINGTDYPANPISVQGGGGGKPVVLYWSTLLPLAAGDEVKLLGFNGDAGSFTCTFTRSRFSIEYKGPL